MSESVLIYDIESRNKGFADVEHDTVRIFSAKSFITGKTYHVLTKEEMQLLIDKHKIIVGFNNVGYDNPILERFGISFKYKTIIDLLEVLKKRSTIIELKDGTLNDLMMSHSLDFVTKLFGLVTDDGKIQNFDYSLFNKEVWTEQERKLIKEYCERDIELTAKLYQWLADYFDGFKEFMYPEDIEKKRYISCSTAALAYKAICHAMGWKEEYEEVDEDDDSSKYGGGYVAYPAGEEFHGDIYCLDFQSMYPSIMMQCNLFGRQKTPDDRKTWNGNNYWQVSGNYYADEIHLLTKLIKSWFNTRLILKREKNKKQLTYKILLNATYGTIGSAKFKHLYDLITASDCTSIGRQWIKHARSIFRQQGYKLLTTDTDSCFILDPFHDKERLMKVKQEIVDFIKSTVPFPHPDFAMGLDAEIRCMFFFKGKSEGHEDDEMDEDDYKNKGLGLMKKNYIYVTKTDKLVIKNLGIRKKSVSKLSRHIFNEYLKPEIIKNETVKFSKTHIQNIIDKLLTDDISFATLRYNVKSPSSYKKSENGLHIQIAKKYGAGLWFLVPNNKIGVGKDKKYCTLDEFKQCGLKKQDINYDNFWNELSYFIKPIERRGVFDF